MFQPMKSAQKRLRFSADDDLALLREFVSQNPLQDAGRWEIIQRNVEEITGKKFSIRTLKDHLYLLLGIWRQKDSGSQIKSGVEEIYSERDLLLQEISDICQDSKSTIICGKGKKKINKEKQIVELGRQARDSCLIPSSSLNNYNLDKSMNSEDNMDSVDNQAGTSNPDDYFHITFENMEESANHSEIPLYEISTEENVNSVIVESNESPTTQPTLQAVNNKNHKKKYNSKSSKNDEVNRRILGPVRKRGNNSSTTRRNALEYLNKKEEKDRTIRIRELELQDRQLELTERRIRLDEQRFELEAFERRERLEMEKERFKQDKIEKEIYLKTIESIVNGRTQGI